jgi:CDP-diacylglycerol---glycerol-3-phosphate 3-phosphatidyltransferase
MALMASIYDVKPAFQQLLRPLSRQLARWQVTPNQITISALLLSLLTGICIAYNPTQTWPMLLVPIMLFLRMALNALDGMVAREYNLQSAFGTFLNELGDVLSDVFIYLPFAFVSSVSATLIIAIVILAIISEMTGIIAVQIKTQRRYDGPMGKSDRAFVFGLAATLIAWHLATAWLNTLFAFVAISLVATIFNRMHKALQAQHDYHT